MAVGIFTQADDFLQRWIDDVERFAPGVHRMVWEAVRSRMSFPRSPMVINIPHFKGPPVLPSPDPPLASMSTSVVTIHQPQRSYGPVSLHAARAAADRLFERDMLERVSDALDLNLQDLVLGTSAPAQTVGNPSTLTLEDMQRAWRLLQQPIDWRDHLPPMNWGTVPGTARPPRLSPTEIAGCRERGCTVTAEYRLEQLAWHFTHGPHHLLLSDEIVAHSSSLNVRAQRYIEWARALHEQADAHSLCPSCGAEIERDIEPIEATLPDGHLVRGCSDHCVTAQVMARDLAREHPGPRTQRQREEALYHKSVAANRVMRNLNDGISDSSRARTAWNPWAA